MQNVGDKISGAGEKLLPVTTGITALGTVAVKTGADFDSAMSKVAAASGESEQASAAQALVGKNAMSGFLALMNAAPAYIEKLSGAISDCDGTSLKMAETMQDNLAG